MYVSFSPDTILWSWKAEDVDKEITHHQHINIIGSSRTQAQFSQLDFILCAVSSGTLWLSQAVQDGGTDGTT